MAGDAFEDTLAGFRRWAGAAGRQLHGTVAVDAAELGTLFGLMPDHLEIDAPSQLTPEQLSTLLLEVYPRKVSVLDDEDTADTIPALRDLTAYLADTGAISGKAAAALERELDSVEPDFAGAVMDPANWGPARAAVQAMHRDGVDLNDRDAISRWMAKQNATARTGASADPLTWAGADLRESFGLRTVTAPARIPDQAALAALAASAPLLGDLRRLAADVREAPAPADGVDPLLLRLAVESGLVRLADGALTPGADAARLADLGADADVLGTWTALFALVVDSTLDTARQADPGAGPDLDLAGRGIGVVMELFLGARAGVPVAEVSDGLAGAALAGLPPEAAERQWEEWSAAHGDPAGLLLGQLTRLSAVSVTDEMARLEPLGLFAVRTRLLSSGVQVPELPAAEAMTAEDLVLVSMLGTEQDLQAELDAWVARRTTAGAAAELLAYAAGESAVVRTAAIAVVSRLGAAAEPAWREALAVPALRCYAKPALIAPLAERYPDAPAPEELKITTEDVAWYVADTFAPVTRLEHRGSTFQFDLGQLPDVGVGVSNEALFDAMARLPHPDAEAVLAMIGRHAADKQTAKAARRAAHKAASRRV